jgi:hypothetical protein
MPTERPLSERTVGSQPWLLFRSVNERIRELDGPWGADSYDFVCECAAEGCLEPVPLTPAAFDALYDQDSVYVVAPGHENKDDEVLERLEHYVLVRRQSRWLS